MKSLREAVSSSAGQTEKNVRSYIRQKILAYRLKVRSESADVPGAADAVDEMMESFEDFLEEEWEIVK